MDPFTLLLIGIGIYIFLTGASNGLATNGSGVLPMTSGSGILSAAQIGQLAANAGFQGQDLIIAVAIALAESGGNPSVVGDLAITPGGSVGLWQINLRWHPEYNAAELTDPQTNADAAFAIYQAAGNTFTPWTTWGLGAAAGKGAYLSYMAQATAGVSA